MTKRKSNQVTMKDIALKVGCSINTVSLALNGKNVSEETRDKILAASEELGYIGNSIASSMRSGKTGNIAMIVGDVSNPYFARLIKGTVNLLSANGFNTVVYNTEEREDYERNSIRSAIRQNVDGILICPMKRDNKNIKTIQQVRIPFVVFGGTVEDKTVSTVCLNDVKGGYIATKYLLERGHKRLVFVNGPNHVFSSLERLEGYRQALSEFGLPFIPENVITFAFNSDEGVVWEQVKYALCHKLDFTGVVAYNDQIAMRLISFFQSDDFNDKRILQTDIVGFDNAFEVFPLPINLTSISHAGIDMSVVAPQILLEMLENPASKPRQIVLDVKLYVH